MEGTDPTSLPLRDIHLPDPVSWWPLAPGWWILLLTVIVTIFLIIYFVRRRRNYKLSALYLAKQELARIKTTFDNNQDKKNLVKELSELIRRLSISICHRQEAAALTGQDWLEFLDRYSGKDKFNSDTGRILIEAPYQANPEFNSNDLIDLVSSWLDAVAKSKRGKS